MQRSWAILNRSLLFDMVFVHVSRCLIFKVQPRSRSFPAGGSLASASIYYHAPPVLSRTFFGFFQSFFAAFYRPPYPVVDACFPYHLLVFAGAGAWLKTANMRRGRAGRIGGRVALHKFRQPNQRFGPSLRYAPLRRWSVSAGA